MTLIKVLKGGRISKSGLATMKKITKRATDVLGSLFGLILLLPLFLIISIIIKLNSKGPIFFIQNRPGKNGKIFRLYKFRTMNELRDENGNLLPDEKRLTKFGKLLRRLSLDEIPELWNVIKGDMSLVGPRPLLMDYLKRYTDIQARRHDVRPGITGWAQINGRQKALFSKRLEMDVWYVDHVSFWLDLKILVLTIPKAIFSIGVIPGQDVAEVDDIGLSQPK